MATYEVVIKDLWMRLEDAMGEKMPGPLGPLATPAELSRQQLRVRSVYDEMVDVMKEIDDTIKRGQTYIVNLPSATKDAKDVAFGKFLADFDKDNKFRAVRGVRSKWRDRLNEIDDRLNVDHRSTPASSGTVRAADSKRAKLPQIQLQRFDGTIDSWFSFWDTFRVLVHDETSLSAVEKFNFLQSCLEGEAVELISGIPITPQGYDNAIDLILEKFGDSKKLIRVLNQEIVSLPISEAFADDERLYLKIEKICRLLESLNQTIDEAPYYMNMEGKMSPEVLDKYFMIKTCEDKDDWDTVKFRNAFKRALAHVRGMKEVQSSIRKSRFSEATMSLSGMNFAEKKPHTGYKGADYGGRRENSPRPGQQWSGSPSRTNSPGRGNGPYPREYRDGDRDKSRKGSPYPNRTSSSSRSPSRERRTICAFCELPHSEIDCLKFPTADLRRNRCLKKELCFFCLRANHFASQCRNKSRCIFCKKSHNSALCRMRFGQGSSNSNRSPSPNRRPENSGKVVDFKANEKVNLGREIFMDCSIRDIKETEFSGVGEQTCLSDANDVFSVLKLVSLEFYNPDNPSKCQREFGLLDDGSQKTYIEESLAKELKLKSLEVKTFQIAGIGNTVVGTFQRPIVEFGMRKHEFDVLAKARVLPEIVNAMPLVSLENVSREQLIRNKIFVQLKMIKPRVLIGNDFYNRFVVCAKQRLPSGLWISSSATGDIVNGEGKVTFLEKQSYGAQTQISICGTATENFANDDLCIEDCSKSSDHTWIDMAKKQESLQFLGLNDAIEKNDEEIKRKMESLMTFDGKRYQTGLLWNSLVEKLPSNYHMAYAQLKSILGKLQENRKVLEQYDNIFLEQESMGFIERVPEEEVSVGGRVVHYLPHHAVYKSDSEHTKVRIVFNGAARRGDAPSLNECLEKGPNLYNDLCGILMRSRLKNNLVICDIAKAFLQIELDPNDRDAIRFLWVENPAVENSPIVVFRFKRVTFGVICSPANLALAIEMHLRKYDSGLARELERNVYVDNLMFSADNESQILELCDEVKQRIASRGADR
jgi:hypothetical protein